MSITPLLFYKTLLSNFPFKPTSDQNLMLRNVAFFLVNYSPKTIFMLKGYAGTGKTTLIGALVKSLSQIDKKTVLMAPTGRAAKVISNYANVPAFTIHKKIYMPKRQEGTHFFQLMPNRHINTLFIVDESSMIPDGAIKIFDQRSLLDDLISYVRQGKYCQLLLIGDTAQLPPVNLELSPALDSSFLEANYGHNVEEIELSEVTRQHHDSGILFNATLLRNIIAKNSKLKFSFDLNFPDFIRLTDSYDIQDELLKSYRDEGLEETAFIVYSNKNANAYNQQIRFNILGYDGVIEVGDYLMIVKNNYHWLDDSEHVSFIANGDICELLQIFNFKDLYGFRFAEVKLRLIDYPNQPPFETVILLDTLESQSPALTNDKSNELYHAVSEDYQEEKNKYKRLQAVKKDPYFNALQIKFSYAMTCHKSQGGQWDTVFVEKPYLPEGPNISYLRWLYTAITRAKKKVYLIGFKDENFEE